MALIIALMENFDDGAGVGTGLTLLGAGVQAGADFGGMEPLFNKG